MRKLAAIGLAMVIAPHAAPRSAAACNESATARRVLGVASDGRAVVLETYNGGTWHASISVRRADGSALARCEQSEGSELRWACRDASPLGRPRSRDATRAAHAWAVAIGASTALVAPATTPPPGIVEAICARVPDAEMHLDAPVSCSASNVTLLVAPDESQWFVRFAPPRVAHCGAYNTHDVTHGLDRATLATRLRGRITWFERRVRLAHARRAAEALAYLLPGDDDASAALARLR